MTKAMKLLTLAKAVQAAKTHRQKAELEAKIRKLINCKPDSKDYTLKLSELGLNRGQFKSRRLIYRSKLEYAWELLDIEHLSAATVVNLIREAQKNASLQSCSIDEALKKEYKRSCVKNTRVVTKNGIAFQERNTDDDSVKKSWCKIHEAIKVLVSIEFKHLDHIEHVKFEQSLDSDIKGLLHQYKIRANSSVKNGLKADSPALRRHFLAALDEIGISRPGRGQVINQEYANQLRAAYRRRAGESHPDRHPDNNHMAQKFIRINKEYEIVEQYLNAQGVST